MRLATDDETAEVSNIFLGPQGYLLPWRARYSAYGIGLALSLLLLILERRMGLSVTPWTVILSLGLVIFTTRAIGKTISHEVPLQASLPIFWHEIGAPRIPTKIERADIRPGRIRTLAQCAGPSCNHMVPVNKMNAHN